MVPLFRALVDRLKQHRNELFIIIVGVVLVCAVVAVDDDPFNLAVSDSRGEVN